MLSTRDRNRLAISRRSGVVIGWLGIVLSVVVFLAQGPYHQIWQYALVLAPLVIALLIIRAGPTVQSFRRYRRAWIHAREAFDWVTGTDITSTFTVRVQNTKGDLLYERYFRVEVLRDGVVENRTKQDLVGAEVPIPDFPPEAKVLASRPSGVKLVPHEPLKTQTTRGGHLHYDCRWAYNITPALRKKGDFVEYSYSSLIPKCEAKAFTEGGALFFFLHESIPLDVEYSLIAPPRYTVQIVDAWIEDSDRVRIDLPDEDRPTLAIGAQVMTWHPTYRKGHSYICRYRLIGVDFDRPLPPGSMRNRPNDR